MVGRFLVDYSQMPSFAGLFVAWPSDEKGIVTLGQAANFPMRQFSR